jgi:hypothetical protein
MLALACGVAFIHGAGHAIDAQVIDMHVLRIELVVVRGLGKQQIDMVEREVDAIWAPQEVTIEWSDHVRASSVRVVIDRPSSALPAAPGDEGWPVAMTPTIDGRVAPPIYVSLDAAERVVRASSPPYSAPALAGVMLPRVVGRALAHELAHFLLNTRAHTPSGLLRGRFTPDDFVSPVRDAFNLDRAQIALAQRHPILLALHP